MPACFHELFKANITFWHIFNGLPAGISVHALRLPLHVPACKGRAQACAVALARSVAGNDYDTTSYNY